MSQQDEGAELQERIALVVPMQHVKTVKTALEQNGQLDRSSKITAETPEIGQAGAGVSGLKDINAMGSNVSYGQAHHSTSASGAPSGSSNIVQFPSLQLDPVTEEYRDPKESQSSSVLQFDETSGQYDQPVHQPQFPTLEFDLDSGEYKESSAPTRFPKLEFDPRTGEYGDSPKTRHDPTLIFNIESGQCEKGSEPLHLDFDPRTGTYKREKSREQRMRIPTTIPYDDTLDHKDEQNHKSRILEHLGLNYLSQAISLSHSSPRSSATSKNALHRALQSALEAIEPTLLDPLNLTAKTLLSHFPDSYSIYTPMLLLPHNAFTSSHWSTLFSTHPPDSTALLSFWQRVTNAVNTTHIAVNSPIPASTSSTTSTTTTTTTTTTAQENILRSPINITPIFGDFGPVPTPQTLSSPTSDDFKNAFWVRTTQNGIQQTWAPLYTMFSRGNVKEKARLLNLPSVAAATATNDTHSTAVAADLYAGIGYFAFSYRKAGFATVLGWELNPWSVEGLRRGAGLNGWSVRIITPDDLPAFVEQEQSVVAEDFLVFQMSNEGAGDVVKGLKGKGRLEGGIDHVNLGLLPLSVLSWGTAVGIIDLNQEGWIHAHENVGVGDIETRAREVESEFQRLINELGAKGEGRTAKVEHVERVKMYAPGVAHCVFDVCISPAKQQ